MHSPLYEAGERNCLAVINNSATPEQMAKDLKARFQGLTDDYSRALAETAQKWLKEKKDGANRSSTS